jgi:hypothetical protein
MVNDDGEVSLDELLMQIEQLQPVYQEPVYQAPEPVYVAPEPVYQPEVNYYAQQFAPDVFAEVPTQVYQPEPVYQPVFQQPEVQQPYVEPQTVQEVINQIATQLPPSVVNEIIARQPIEQPIQQDADAPVEQLQPAKPIEETKPSVSVIDRLTKQILGSSDTSKWEGGVGAETAAKDMAKIMAGIGITDISQFGKITQTGLQEDVRPDGRGGYVDQRGNPVDPNIVQTGSYETEGGRIDYTTAPVGTQVTYGNKETNQAVPITYSERQTGNAFGGTFEGKGNTGYRVDFDASGKPVFYTTGASSRDDIGVFAPIIAAALTPILGPAAASLLGPTASTLATNALTGALVGGSTSAITGDSIAKGALLGGAGGAFADIISPYLPSAPTELTERQFAIADAKQLASSGIPTDQISEILSAGGYNDAIVNRAMDAIATAPVAVTAPTTQPPIETVQVSAPVAPTPTVNEVINAIVNQQPEVQVTAEQQPVAPTPVTPTVEEIVRTLTEPTPTPVAPVENVQVTAPVEITTPTVSEIINSITQPAVTEPTVVEQTPQTVAPVETVQVTEPTQTAAPTTNEIVSAIIQAGITEPAVIEQIINAVAPPEVQITESVQPTTPTISEVINSIAQIPVEQPPVQQVPTPVEVTAPRAEAPIAEAPQTVQQVIASIIPELVMTSQAPKEPEQPIPTIVAPPIQETVPQITTIAERPSTITNEAEPAPTIVAPPITGTVPPKTYTASEIIDMIRLGVLGASVLGATTQETGPTGFPIVPVPADWKSPTYAKDLPSVAPTQLPPIDFGNRNLLIGTQWEKFLDPNYGKVPAPVQFNQPSDMSYDRLMSILGTSRDVLPSQALSINDVISGIQNQYGQTPTGSMG